MDPTSRKRKHRTPLVIDIGDITFVINRSIRQCIFDFETSIFPDRGTSDRSFSAEFSLMEIFPNDNLVPSSFLLFLASSKIYSNLADEHGISINGRVRGQATRFMIKLRNWKLFTVKDLQKPYTIFLEGRISKDQNVIAEKELKVSEVEQLELIVLKRLLGQKGKKELLLLHIQEVYGKLSGLTQLIEVMGIDKKEMCDTIDSLKVTIQREQKKTENAKRSISAQKGMITKRLNALDLETSNRDTEWNKSAAKIAKQHGYNKMVATKNSNMLEREKNKIKKDQEYISLSKISLPLLIFDCLKESVSLLSTNKNNKSLRSILSTLIPLLIPSSSERTEQNHSNHSIGNILGFNEKSRIAKHYFERSDEIHKLKKIDKDNLTAKMIEDVLAPLERYAYKLIKKSYCFCLYVYMYYIIIVIVFH